MAEFTFDNTVEIRGIPSRVWSTMTDVPRLVSWIEVLHDAQTIEELARYSAVIADRVGMFRLRADLDIRVTEKVQDEHITILAEGEDRQVGSRILIEATVELKPRETATTVRVFGKYSISGPAATLGASTIQRKGQKIVDEFFGHMQADTVS